eukprot:s1184_g2.t1
MSMQWMWRWFFLALHILHSGVAAQLSGCTSDVVRYMEKMQASFMSAAAEAANYLPIGRCDCILDDDTKETPLHRVVNLASHGGVAPGPLSVVVEALLAKHGDLSAQDQSGATPLTEDRCKIVGRSLEDLDDFFLLIALRISWPIVCKVHDCDYLVHFCVGDRTKCGDVRVKLHNVCVVYFACVKHLLVQAFVGIAALSNVPPNIGPVGALQIPSAPEVLLRQKSCGNSEERGFF